MHLLLNLLLLACAISMVALFAQGFYRPRKPRHLAANINEGQSLTGLKTYTTSSAFATRYRLAKEGASAILATIVSAATDRPLGVATDEAASGDAIAVAVLGATVGTLKVGLNSTVTLGDQLTPDATGYARTLPTADGVYWVFGRALQSGVAGDIIEFVPCYPKQIQYASAAATTRL